MTTPAGPPKEATPDETQDIWIDVYRHREQRSLNDAAFVLTALAVPFQVQQWDNDWVLYVPQDRVAYASEQLTLYFRENSQVRFRPPDSPAIDSGWAGVLGFLLVIWAAPWFESWVLYGWREAGVMSAGSVLDGQWWRTVTALTLHADFPHILSNSLFGALFGGLLARQLGSGIGWLFIVSAAALANGCNAFWQPGSFRSIGASTATFAALGLLAAVVWRRGFFKNRDWRRSFAPIFAAIAMVAFTGVGGENTDVFAHFFGFGSGLCIGFAAAALPTRALRLMNQWLAGGASLSLVGGAWLLALR